MWEIKRESLLAALEILNVVPDKLGIPSSEYFWVRGKGSKITMSVASYIAAEVSVEGNGDWPIKGDFYLDRRLFLPFVNAARELKDKHRFQFSYHKKQLIVKHGSRCAAFDSQSKVKGYGNLSKILKGKNSSIPINDDLTELLSCGKNCAVSDSVVPHLNCVYVTKGKSGLAIATYAASDKVFYMGLGKLEEGKIKTSIPFPLYLISLLSLEGIRKISWIGKYIVLKFKHGVIWQPISEEALTEFPLARVQRHAEKANKLPVTFVSSSRRFARLMVRLGYYLQSVRRKDWVVKIKGYKKESSLKVTTNIPGAGFSDKIATTKVLKKDFKMEWPLDILEPIFSFLSVKTKKLGVIVRIDKKHGLSYVTVGPYWLCIPSRQE